MKKYFLPAVALALLLALAFSSCSKERHAPLAPGDINTATCSPTITVTPTITPTCPGPTIGGTITWTDLKGQQYALYLPYTPACTRLPVVMYLHGFTGDPINSPPWIIASLNLAEPCAVFMPFRPQSEGASAWGGTYDYSLRPAMVDALAELDSLIQARNFVAGRQYLYGDSMGAEGVLKLMVEYPDRFAGAVSVAGYTVVTGAAAMAQEMAKTSLWLIWGETDTSLNVESWNIYNLILLAGGTRVRHTEYPGLGHNGSISAAASEPGLCEWLLAQRRP